MKHFISLSLFVLSFFLILHAQEYRHYTATNGLSGTDVTAICENENFLWIATNDGLNRFDGQTFKVYKNENSSGNNLSENNIETLMFDSQGLLWIGFKTGGLDIYNPRKNEFTHISKIIKEYPQRVISIYEDAEHNIWLGSWGDGLYQLTPSGNSYIVTKHFAEFIVSSIAEKPKGILWVGTYYGYFIYDINKKKWIETNRNDYAITQFQDTGEKNSLWFSVWSKGLFKVQWDESFNSINDTHIVENGGDIYRIYPASDNQLYLGTWGDGIKIANIIPSNKTIELTSLSEFKAPVILSFFRDKYNKLWIGTYGTGLYCLNNEGQGMQRLAPINENGFSAAYVLCNFGNNYLLVGTQGDGLFLYDLKKHRLLAKRLKGSGSPFGKYILSIYSDNELLIVGNDNEGIHYTPLNQGAQNTDFSLRSFTVDKQMAKVTSIFKDSKSRFWLGTKQNGLISLKYDTAKETFSDYMHYDSFGMDEITGFAECPSGGLWIASHSGIYLFDPLTKKVEKYGQSDISEMVYSLVDDPKNRCLWLGTSVGLRKLDYSKDYQIEKLFSTELLPIGAIKDVLLDEYNNLWFSIADRVFCFVDSQQKLREINSSIWGSQTIMSSGNVSIDDKRYIVFGGTNNLLLIDPQKILNQPNETRIVLTELQIDHRKVNVGEKVYGKIVLNEETEYIESLTLSYRCKWISLSFTEIGWDNFRNKYQYKIKGFSDNWQYLDVSKPITFSQLPTGSYTFSIRRNDSNLSENEESCCELQITITPPWWQTKWFYTLLACAILGVLLCVFFIVRDYYKKRQQQRFIEIEKKKKEELLQEKESFFAGLSHDLLTPFSLIMAPTNDLLREPDIQEDRREKLEIISRNASYLSDIFSTILDFKRAELIDVEIKEKNIELVSFLKIIVNAFEYLAKSKQIELSFHSNISDLTISIDAVKLERILYNLISNSLKFTNEGGTVDISLTYGGIDTFAISVKDTGIGIDQQNISKVFDKFYQEEKDDHLQGLGLGLYTARKFVLVLGGNISIKSELEKGTTVTINLPAHKVVDISDLAHDKGDDSIFTILLVEDNAQLRDYLKKKLAAYFDVAVASNGVEALDFIKHNFPEIVISDVMMPEMDGLTLCSTIKDTPMYSDIFVVLLSAKSSIEDELQGYKSGADFYLKKPFDAEVLIKQIINIYATRQQRKKQIISELFSSQSDGLELNYKDDFLPKAIEIVKKHLTDENFKIDDFAAEMNVSKTVLHRKFKVIIGETPNIFIRNMRLHKAAKMLIETDLSIAEIAYLTGFSQSHYFIKCFKELFQDTPKNFRMRHR